MISFRTSCKTHSASSPEEHKGDTFDKLLKERDSLIREIRAFEKKKIPAEQWMMYPKPDVIYQMNLQYLSVLCDYIAERYNAEFVSGEYDDM